MPNMSYVFQVVICFVSFYLLLTWIIVAINPFGVICYLLFPAIRGKATKFLVV